MDSRKTFASQVIMSVLCAKLSLVSTIGNGSFLAIFARFKNLRNFPNILFANLAAVDFLNAIINVPLYVLSYVWETSWMKGKTWAIISSSLHLEFTILNIVSMFALMLDRFLALYLDLKYFTWKTTKKAYGVVVLIWLVCTVLVALSTIPLLFMDLDDPTVGESRGKIFQDRKELLASIIAVFILAATVLGILTSYTLHRNKIRVRNDFQYYIYYSIKIVCFLLMKLHG